MDFSPYYGAIVIIATAIYMTVGWYYKGLKQGESFEWKKCGETVVLVVLLTVTGLMAGVTVTADWISAMLGSLGDNPVAFTAIMAALIGLIDQFIKNGGRILTGSATTSVVTTQTKASLPAASTTPEAATPSFPAGKAAVLGIYGNSAASTPPAQSYVCDVNQVPMLYFDTLTLVTGKVLAQIVLDGAPLKDWEENGMSLKAIGEKLPHDFWIPQKYRTVGAHTLEIRMGHLEGAENTTPGGLDSDVVWEDVAQVFTLTFTGTKASE